MTCHKHVLKEDRTRVFSRLQRPFTCKVMLLQGVSTAYWSNEVRSSWLVRLDRWPWRLGTTFQIMQGLVYLATCDDYFGVGDVLRCAPNRNLIVYNLADINIWTVWITGSKLILVVECFHALGWHDCRYCWLSIWRLWRGCFFSIPKSWVWIFLMNNISFSLSTGGWYRYLFLRWFDIYIIQFVC